METGAIFSACRRYRFRLWRRWDDRPLLNFIMLNPSTADESTNDPTVARCQVRAQRLGFGGLVVTNLFAWRNTDPAALAQVADPVGVGNDRAIIGAARYAGLVVCGWGKDGKLLGRGVRVLDMLRTAGITPHYLKLNSDGQPGHPLYLPYSLEPRPLVAANDNAPQRRRKW